MKYFLFLIISTLIAFLLLNLFLNVRSKTNSNKFIEKIFKRLGISFVKFKRQGWAIKTFITEKKIKDLNNKDIPKDDWFQINNKECVGVADPFLFLHKNLYYLFFEYEKVNKIADIAYATSNDGLNWNFQSKILTEAFHQSFPFVFLQKEEIYMLPESYQSNQVRLYKATEFPQSWELDKVLYEGKKLVDTIFLEKEGCFYWFTTNLESDELELYYSENLHSKWVEHPMSPISKDKKNNRNAGEIIVDKGSFYRLAQDATEGYGSGVNLYKIEDLTNNSYRETPIKTPLLFKDIGIKKDAIHHISFLVIDDKKLVVVDGANFGVKGLSF